MLLAQMVVEYTANVSGLGIAVNALAEVGKITAEVAAKSVEMAGDFQSSMTRLVTSAGESHKNIKMIGDGILDMSTQVGTGAQKLGDAMFWIESGGAHGTAALTDLKIAAMGAKTENANLDDVAKTLMFTLNNYADTGLTAANAMNILIASAGQGEMSLQDLSIAVSNVMPTAHAFGIHLEDIGAGLATMTNLGDDASSAATHLAMMIKTLEAPSKAGSDALKSIGLSTQQVSDEMRVSLPGALEMIVDHLKKKFPEGSTAYNEALKNISGGSKSMQAILETTGTNLDKFKNNIDVVTKAAKDGGASVNNWADIQGTFNFKMDQAKAMVEKWGIEIGSKLLPVLGKVADAFTSPGFQQFATSTGQAISKAFDDISNFVTPLAPKFLDIANNFMKVSDAFKNPAFQKLATELSGDLKTGITWLINALASPQFGIFMHIVGVGIAAAILFVIPLVKEIAQNVIKFAEDIVTRVKPQIDNFMRYWPMIADVIHGVWDELCGWIKIAWALFSGIIKVGLDILNGDWGAAWHDMQDMFNGIWDGMKQALKGAIEIMIGTFRPLLEGLAKIPGPAGDMARNVLNSFDTMTKGANDATNKMKIDTVQHTIDMQNSMIKSIDNVRQQLIQKMIDTKDPVKKHALEMQIGVTEQMEKMHINARNKATDMKNDLVGHSIIPDMVSSIGDWFNKLPGMALDAGTNICKSIGTGITNALHFVTDAMTNVTSWISAHLPHSPAKVGPLMDLQNQGMEISNQVAKGMVNGVPLITSAMNNLAKPVTVGLKGVASTNGVSPLQGGNQDNSVHVYIDGKEVTGTVMKRVQRELRGHGLKK